jgi:ATP-binding cassette subfamily C protein
MAALAALLGSLTYIMVFAVINGSLGFLLSMGVTVFGSLGVAKMLGESIALSMGAIAGLAVVCGVLRGLLRYVEQYSNHFIAFRLLAVLRDKIFRALRTLCPAKLETKEKGRIISMITSDVETLEVFYAHTLSPIAIAVLTSAAAVAFVWLYAGWSLALIVLGGHLAIGVAAPFISDRTLRKKGAAYREEFASFNAYLLDSVKGIKEIVLHNAGAERTKEVNRRSDRLLADTKTINMRSNLSGAVVQAAAALFVAGALVIAVVSVLNGSLTIGRAVVGLTAVFGSFGAVFALSALPGNLSQTFASGDRLLDLFAEKPSVTPVTDGKKISFNRLDVKDLRFGYGETEIIKGAEFTAQKGEIIGIVGESGGGKSTLLKLLLRFWQKDGGSIEYDGAELDEIDTDSLLENVTLISQTTYLFDDTVEYNLKIAKPDATADELVAACQKASIHDFIAALPDAYKTRVGDLGDKLSTGERQRIALARAFLRNSPLILLDEPTSNVDSINEGVILAALKAQKSDKCIILVSHRESTMAAADRVLRLENGRLIPTKIIG